MSDSTDNTSQNTRVDFYLLKGANPQNIFHFCCRLTDKAWKLGNTVFVRTEDEQQAQLLDNLLWTYNDGSFVPHTRIDNSGEDKEHNFETPVVIGSKKNAIPSCDLMINLAYDIPDSCSNYLRIAEIVNEDETIKNQGRKRYAQYDKSHYPLNHHNISA